MITMRPSRWWGSVVDAIRLIRTDLGTATGLLTRLPAGWLIPGNKVASPGRDRWCFPLVGALVGLLVAIVVQFGAMLHLTPLLRSCWGLVVGVLVTGGLHEDGMADTADGMGAGGDRERRLAIMRDSRIGSFGAAALILTTLLRVTGLAALTDPLVQLPMIGALSRLAPVLVMTVCPPARPSGLGRSAGTGMHPLAAAVALGIAGVTMIGLGDIPVHPVRAVSMLAITLFVSGTVATLGRRQLGGQTGDLLGTAVVTTECALLSLAATR